MERLTFLDYFGEPCFQIGDTVYKNEVSRRLAHYEDLEEQGRLVELPCAVGSEVYGYRGGEIKVYTVSVISVATYNWYLRCQNHDSDFWITDVEIGKTVFLTRSEAEAALAAASGVLDG